jgi:hypothetical protein
MKTFNLPATKSGQLSATRFSLGIPLLGVNLIQELTVNKVSLSMFLIK